MIQSYRANMHPMTSSLRSRPLDVTLAYAIALAKDLGIVRVTDTTRLDCIGLPVFASIRPDAEPGSLCVNAGKGARLLEAKVGAYMEAIEFAYAEYRSSHLAVMMSTGRLLLDQPSSKFDPLDLCPVIDRVLDDDTPIACVAAHELWTGDSALIPAELVFHPFHENPGTSVYGSSTNGLCSGNSPAEALVHGLCELMERDVRAFNFFDEQSALVELDSLPDSVSNVAEQITDAGLSFALRSTENIFGLPYFEAAVLEPWDGSPIPVATGHGLHLDREIAAIRAVCEAAQSRLSHIHGGRDDLLDRVEYFARRDTMPEESAVALARAQLLDSRTTIAFTDVAHVPEMPDSIDDALATIISRLVERGFDEVFAVELSPPESALSVMRVVVPKMESFRPSLMRMGRRLAGHLVTKEVRS